MSTAPRTCIIGAGSTGIAVAKALYERGIDFDSYELSDRVGGNWVLGNVNGVSSSYSSLHINTSRERMEYSDYPMPKDYPDFPQHDHIAAYFDDYVDHFGFRDRIKFGVGVEHVEPAEGGGFDVRTSEGETVHYDAVVVANGHHWDARWPEPAFPGSDTFEGEQIHAHDYKNEKQLRDKDVVVLGMGNSAMDIAVDASYHAKSTILAARRGAWILPKYLFGKPVDKENKLLDHMPASVRWPILQKLLASQVGKPSDYGLPEPDHKLGHAHPTVSGRILDRLAHGAITVKPNIACARGRQGAVHRRHRGPRRPRRLLHGLQDHLPVLRRGLHLGPGQRAAALQVCHVPPRVREPVLPRARPALGAIMPIAERQSTLVTEASAAGSSCRRARRWSPTSRPSAGAMKKRYVALEAAHDSGRLRRPLRCATSATSSKLGAGRTRTGRHPPGVAA